MGRRRRRPGHPAGAVEASAGPARRGVPGGRPKHHREKCLRHNWSYLVISGRLGLENGDLWLFHREHNNGNICESYGNISHKHGHFVGKMMMNN